MAKTIDNMHAYKSVNNIFILHLKALDSKSLLHCFSFTFRSPYLTIGMFFASIFVKFLSKYNSAIKQFVKYKMAATGGSLPVSACTVPRLLKLKRVRCRM